jgi:hypothetical protein
MNDFGPSQDVLLNVVKHVYSSHHSAMQLAASGSSRTQVPTHQNTQRHTTEDSNTQLYLPPSSFPLRHDTKAGRLSCFYTLRTITSQPALNFGIQFS